MKKMINDLDVAKLIKAFGKRPDYCFGIPTGEFDLITYVQKELGSSSILKVSDINYIDNSNDKRAITINKLDTILTETTKFKRVGIKIDVEGFELDVIKGASKTLKKSKFLIAEVRHNHKSFKKLYKFSY